MSRKQRTKQDDKARRQAAPDGRIAKLGNGANGGNGTVAGGPPTRTKTAEDRRPTHRKRSDGPFEEPLQKGDMVVIRMRSDWELEGELRAINDEVVRIFDFAVCDVLRLRRKDIAQIERLVDAD